MAKTVSHDVDDYIGAGERADMVLKVLRRNGLTDGFVAYTDGSGTLTQTGVAVRPMWFLTTTGAGTGARTRASVELPTTAWKCLPSSVPLQVSLKAAA